MKTEVEWELGSDSPGDAKTASSHQQLEEAWSRLSLRVSRRNQFCQHLDFGLLASTIMRDTFLCEKPPTPVICCGNHGKLITLMYESARAIVPPNLLFTNTPQVFP